MSATHLIWLFLLVGGSMALKDVAYVAAEFLVARSRALWASLCDIAGDFASVLTYGLSGYEVVKHGFGPETVGILVAIAAGSLLGTTMGVRLGHILDGWSWHQIPAQGPKKSFNKGRTPQAPARPMLPPDEARQLLSPSSGGPSPFERLRCEHCGGIHTRTCPRVKKLSSDGSKREVEYWPWGEWPLDDIIWLDDLYAAEEEENG